MHGRQGTGKASLAPVARTKGGKTYWAARGSIPIRRGDGTVASRRIERGFGAHIRTEAQRYAQCAAWNQEYEERFSNPWRSITFARAFKNYVGKGHPIPWKAKAILTYLGEMLCSEIDDSIMDDLGNEIWPDGVSPKTLNRHLYSPIISILHQTLKEKAPHLARPKGHRDITPLDIPPDDWYKAIYPNLSGNQKAVLIFLASHGRRIGEALSCTPKSLNPDAGTLDLDVTKTGELIQVQLNPLCIPFLTQKGWKDRKWLFGCGPSSANSFRRDFRAACKRAGLPYYNPHAFGRHKSVSSMLQQGWSTKHVADAHHMTEEMVAKRYGHLAKKEVTTALHKVGSQLWERILAETPMLLTDAVVDAPDARPDEERGGLVGDEDVLLTAIKRRHELFGIDVEEENGE